MTQSTTKKSTKNHNNKKNKNKVVHAQRRQPSPTKARPPTTAPAITPTDDELDEIGTGGGEDGDGGDGGGDGGDGSGHTTAVGDDTLAVLPVPSWPYRFVP